MRCWTAQHGGESGAAPSWSCRIKLSRNFDHEGKPLLEKPPEETFCTVTNKSHIAACVTAAQAVLLNPTAVQSARGGARAYLPILSGKLPKESNAKEALGSADQYELAFTANKVVLDIDGAEADLTIIDLPGIIHDHPRGKQYVELVERMTKACLAPENHIIAMALPAGLDPETQAIRAWVREVDPSGHRSIGIVTKPDTLAEDAHIANCKLVELVCHRNGSYIGTSPAPNHDHHLRLGYYVVKNPTQEQLVQGITFTAAREAEARYFADSQHWASAVAKSPRLTSRLGTKNLRTGLSDLLVERIQAQLPAIRRTAREQLALISRDLAALPPPPGEDALQELRDLLGRFAEVMEGHVRASSVTEDRAFFQKTLTLYQAYGKKAVRSMPAFVVDRTLITALSTADKGVSLPPPDAIGTEEGDLDLSPWLEGTAGPKADASAMLGSHGELQRRLEASLFPQQHMPLYEVRSLRRKHIGRELPGFSPYSAVEDLIRRYKGQWSRHALECLGEVAAAAHELSGRVVEDVFKRYPRAQLSIGMAFSDYMEELVLEAESQIKGMLAKEDADVYTINDRSLRQMFDTFLGRLKKAYLRPRALDDDGQHRMIQVMHGLATLNLTFTSYDELFMAQTTDADDELRLMAACLAYFKVAFRRIADNVPITIRGTLLKRLGNKHGLVQALLRHAGLEAGPAQDAAVVARALLAEDEALAEQRTRLRGMEQRLRGMEQRLRGMEQRLRRALAALHAPSTAAAAAPG
ncbi:hypothetical protein GPECTOR_16g664 [Gonium pectorale]|uniref:GED domain-containing protein n=1 Tax=Gonium pectorale TaxID=33097 RepID=A0A150GKW3_GONPE|nr:hypothetical protein GPECTOR_16g664 [Gonium pectorale]|eukprot:KXZ50489.1 hypothetical protein GPECTOR_16g664 [Gonium pectorale]